MFVVIQLYFQIVEEIDYMFRPFSGWAIIRLRLQYRGKLIYYNVEIKNGEIRSRFTMFGEMQNPTTHEAGPNANGPTIAFHKQRPKKTAAHVSKNLQKTRQIKP
jgi:hypothetical protein